MKQVYTFEEVLKIFYKIQDQLDTEVITISREWDYETLNALCKIEGVRQAQDIILNELIAIVDEHSYTLEEVIATIDHVQEALQSEWSASFKREQEEELAQEFDYRDGLRIAQDMLYNEVIAVIDEK